MRRFGYRSQIGMRRRLALTLAALLMGLMAGVLLMDARLRPTIEMFSGYQAKVFATRAINDAIYNELAMDSLPYDTLVTLSQNSAGEVTALQTDMVTINRLRGRATNAVLESLSTMEDQIIRVPLGTLSGVQLLSGRGPVVELKVIPSGYLQTSLENRFDSAGINQTRHQILLIFDMSVTALIPGYTVTTQVSTSFCLAETVIVGAVPEAFTSVNGADSDLTRQIFDYRAKAGE